MPGGTRLSQLGHPRASPSTGKVSAFLETITTFTEQTNKGRTRTRIVPVGKLRKGNLVYTDICGKAAGRKQRVKLSDRLGGSLDGVWGQIKAKLNRHCLLGMVGPVLGVAGLSQSRRNIQPHPWGHLGSGAT